MEKKTNKELGEEIDRIADRIQEDASGWSYPRDEDIERLWAIAQELKEG